MQSFPHESDLHHKQSFLTLNKLFDTLFFNLKKYLLNLCSIYSKQFSVVTEANKIKFNESLQPFFKCLQQENKSDI